MADFPYHYLGDMVDFDEEILMMRHLDSLAVVDVDYTDEPALYECE